MAIPEHKEPQKVNNNKVTKVLLTLALPFRVEDEDVRLLDVLIRIWDGWS